MELRYETEKGEVYCDYDPTRRDYCEYLKGFVEVPDCLDGKERVAYLKGVKETIKALYDNDMLHTDGMTVPLIKDRDFIDFIKERHPLEEEQ